MSFHIRFFSLISKNRVVKSVTEKDANLIILRLTPLAANFLTGYNMKSIEERNKFDEDTLCKDYGKKIMLWGILYLIGIGIDMYFPGKGIRIASILWIILFLQFLIERHKRES